MDPGDLSLSDLALMEELQPDIAELREHLARALVVAERIDKARGRSSEATVGPNGWDLAEEVHQLLCTVESQSLGAAGKGLE